MHLKRWWVGVLAVVLLAACGGNSPPAALTPAAPNQPTVTPVPAAEAPATRAPATVPAQPTEVVPTLPATAAPALATADPTAGAPIGSLTSPVPATDATPTPGLDAEEYAVLGAPDAPITIYEFSDYGCPACRQYALFTFPAIKEEYIDTGKVRYVFKDYPVVSRQGGLAAQAAECAGEQGYYWEMHDQLFLNPEEWDTSPEAALVAFRRYAEAYNMDADALVACVNEGRYQADVDRDVEEALEIGWFGTPTFFINRKMLSGALPPAAFREVLDRELEAAP